MHYEEAARKLPVREFDVVVAGGGTAGVVAAVAAARQGAKTALVELKRKRGQEPFLSQSILAYPHHTQPAWRIKLDGSSFSRCACCGVKVSERAKTGS